MTKKYLQPGDNNGLCEGCNDPSTQYQTQTGYPVLLAGFGPGGREGWGKMWLCPKCLKEHQERDREKT